VRIRLLHPEFFTDPTVCSLSYFTRHVFSGLWVIADRRGVLEDNVKMINGLILPRDHRSCGKALAELEAAQLIRRYDSPGGRMIHVVNFLKYQHPHPKEKPGNLHGPAVEITRPDPSVSISNTVIMDGPSAQSMRTPPRPNGRGQQAPPRRVAADAGTASRASAPVVEGLEHLSPAILKKIWGTK
jgi:hypothetical protein